jgi:23S rRNA (adenine2030-N6)-methyltransferase
LRAQDRLIAIEKHPQEAAALAGALKAFPNAKAVCADGYERLCALLPPPERRGLILIDPPYESPDEFERVSRLLGEAHRRFATGIYLVWFPVKSKPEADAFCGEVTAHGIVPAQRIDIDVGGGDEKLHAAGLLVVNPPYGFEEEMRAAALLIAPRLGESEDRPAEIAISELR